MLANTLREHVENNYSPDMETIDPPYGEVFIWTIQDYFSSGGEVNGDDVLFMTKHGVIDLLDDYEV